jgi:DNA-binding NarL/FixJ family response regulator
LIVFATGVFVIRILVVDDVEAVRLGIVAFLGSVPELTVVGTCCDGSEAAAACRTFQPHVVLMDVSMPGVNGIDATPLVLAASPQVRVLILSSAVDGATVRRARTVGAVGYLLKSGEPDDLVSAVVTAAAGGQWWCRPAAEALRHAN